MATVHLPKSGAERRAHPRMSLPWDAAVGFANEFDLLRATIEDISGGGVCIRTALEAGPGDELLVILSTEEESIAALARTVRAEAIGPEEFRLHLQFRWLQESSRQSLAQLFRPRSAGGGPD